MVIARRSTSWKLLPILLLGAALRLVGLNNVSPPGLAHDEVANWLIDRSILAGQHAVYFTDAYGHEAAFHYVQAGFVALLGNNALALRLPAAFMGLLGVAVTFVLARRLFGPRVAWTSAALLAVLFYPVFYSRLGLRAIMLPLLAGLSATFWWRGWPAGQERKLHYFVLAGLFAGLSLHTYMAARVVPIFYALFTISLALLHRQAMRHRLRQILVFWIVMLAIASPLFIYLLTNPGAEFRIGEVDAPLRALREGDLRPVVDNTVDILGAFGVAGDPLWRQNIASMPVFDPLLALLFYTCLGLLLLYVRDVRHLFLILWLLTATIPSIVTIDAPSSIRMINILPVLTILPAIVMHNLRRLSTESVRLSTAPVDKWLFSLFVGGLLLFHTVRTANAIFVTWPANEEVQFVWQEALTDAAGYLDDASHFHDVAVAGWTPDSMDPPAMELSLRREDLALRYFDPQQTLLIPASSTGAPSLVVRPTILPIHQALRAPLHSSGVISETTGSFVQYRITQMPVPEPHTASDVSFGGEITFLGYTPFSACRQPVDGPGEDCMMVTYWRIQQRPAGQRRIFLHIVDESGDVVDTADALGAPAAFWHNGDILLQLHNLSAESLADHDSLRIGIYDPHSEQRLPTADGPDFLSLQLDTFR